MSEVPSAIPPDPNHDRIARLEIRLTEQEAVIEDLNAAITAQWAVIDRLKRGLARLQEQVEEAAFRAPGAPEPPPPHY
ncbi:SlyX protein [Methylorubrum populi]|uniref:SlyX protein n=1 Tax=Methylobacterium radiotolerans TaxID=31998 RepID=A0ABU7TEP3_9HYPH|nr:SlyX family protein [Methylobacterium sp. B4]PXW66704.1 SlyX protein [Methylobacterium sp. B4]